MSYRAKSKNWQLYGAPVAGTPSGNVKIGIVEGFRRLLPQSSTASASAPAAASADPQSPVTFTRNPEAAQERKKRQLSATQLLSSNIGTTKLLGG